MATNKKKTDQKSDIDEQEVDSATENEEGIGPEEQEAPEMPEDSTAAAGEGEQTDYQGEPDAITKVPDIKAAGIHERLEDLELAMIAAPQEKAGAFNRIAILTGTLKTALPDAIGHVEDEQLRADLETLLALL